MTLLAAGLILLSAFMHAGWNFISKRHNPSLAFFFITAAATTLLLSPLLWIHRQIVMLLPLSLWVLVFATGVAEAVYYYGLAGAYRSGDISLAYPLVRSLPVLMVAGLSLGLGRGTGVENLGLVGMLLITVGCSILPLPYFKVLHWRDYANLVTLMALIAASGTTAYTLIDDTALAQLRTNFSARLSVFEITLLYSALQNASTALMSGLGALLLPAERRQLLPIVRNRSLLGWGTLTGLVIMATYSLSMTAMAYVRNVSYVIAFRQLSIPIGAVLGLTLQGEPRYAPKLWGIGIVSLGLILVGIG